MSDAKPPVAPRATAAFLLLLAFLVGGLGGALVDRFLIRPPVASAAPEPGSSARAARADSHHGGHGSPTDSAKHERGRERYVAQLTRELELTPEQHDRIDTITRQGSVRMRQLVSEVRPRFHAEIERSRAAIDSVLTPQQRERLRQLRKDHESREHGDDSPPPADSAH